MHGGLGLCFLLQIVPAGIKVSAVTVHYQISDCSTKCKQVAAHVIVLCKYRRCILAGNHILSRIVIHQTGIMSSCTNRQKAFDFLMNKRWAVLCLCVCRSQKDRYSLLSVCSGRYTRLHPARINAQTSMRAEFESQQLLPAKSWAAWRCHMYMSCYTLSTVSLVWSCHQ